MLRSLPIIKKTILCLCLFAASLSSAYAEYFGLPAGRSAKISDQTDKSAEVGFVTGEIGLNSYQGIGARFNIKMSPNLVVYGDLQQIDIEETDGQIFGFGFIMGLEGVTQSADLALKASYHTGSTESDGGTEYDGNTISIEALFSGDKLGTSDLSWYANIGLHKFDTDYYDESEIGFGGGVFMPTSFGQFYFGADLIDELIFGLGVRYNL